jgi:hypothetical protein
MNYAFETILIAWLAFAFLPEKPSRSQRGTDGSNPLSSSCEFGTNHCRVASATACRSNLGISPYRADLSLNVRFDRRQAAGIRMVAGQPYAPTVDHCSGRLRSGPPRRLGGAYPLAAARRSTTPTSSRRPNWIPDGARQARWQLCLKVNSRRSLSCVFVSTSAASWRSSQLACRPAGGAVDHLLALHGRPL